MTELITAITNAVKEIGFVQALAVVCIASALFYVFNTNKKAEKNEKEVRVKQKQYLEKANETMLKAIESNNKMSVDVLTGLSELTAEVKTVVGMVKFFTRDRIEFVAEDQREDSP